jgi:hypothetical protein
MRRRVCISVQKFHIRRREVSVAITTYWNTAYRIYTGYAVTLQHTEVHKSRQN